MTHNATPPHVKLAVLADLEAGMSYMNAALKHDVSTHSAQRWMRETGRSKPPASNARPIDDVTRKACERMLRNGFSAHAIAGRLHIVRSRVDAVKADMERRKSQESVVASTDSQVAEEVSQ